MLTYSCAHFTHICSTWTFKWRTPRIKPIGLTSLIFLHSTSDKGVSSYLWCAHHWPHHTFHWVSPGSWPAVSAFPPLSQRDSKNIESRPTSPITGSRSLWSIKHLLLMAFGSWHFSAALCCKETMQLSATNLHGWFPLWHPSTRPVPQGPEAPLVHALQFRTAP